MNILITGASSGLGAALALAYSEEGNRLFLSGRDKARLEAVAREARAKGAMTESTVMDVTNAWNMEDWIKQIDEITPLDLVIANAGVSAGTGKGGERKSQALEIFDTNLYGVLNTIFPILLRMKARGMGQIALMSSMAGFRGLAGAPAYSASKAAVRVYGESLRGELAAQGIKVNVICPGFVKTPMTDQNGFKMPFLMAPEKAARIIKRGLAANKGRITFPWRLAAIVWVLAALPTSWTDSLFQRLPRKP
ncbi:MAG: SDR family NAD(P)-dependent oxidoreductase [Bdellovibrionales bacterium]